MAAISSTQPMITTTQQEMDFRKQLLCRFYLRGSCRDGDWCQFSHNTDLSVPIPETVCWYYLQSHCMYGDNCRFVHMDASSILTNTDGTDEDLRPGARLTSSTRTTCPTIPQPLSELSRETIANNEYNSNTNSNSKVISTERQSKPIRPQLVSYSVLTPTPQPNQSSNPSLITDSRQSSEDSGYSEPTTTHHSSSSTNKCSAGGSGNKTYAQMASNKDSTVSQPKCGNNTTTTTTTTNSTTVPTSVSKTLCPYAINNIDYGCPYAEGQCHYAHGMVCDLCGRSCLDPNDVDQQNKHRDECIREHEREMEISFAVQRSLDKACGICMDIVIEKEPITERRFGILEKCSHIFCLSCIRKWRQTKQFDNRTIRACPECRVSSDFVVPSKYWYDERSEKQALIDSYKKALSTKPCKYFKQGTGECPFAGACFYLHAYPDGRKAEMPPPRQRRRQNHEGELETLRDMLLWNYLEVRDDNHWLLTLDLEDVFDIQEMGLLSGYETDNESDLSDYAENLIG